MLTRLIDLKQAFHYTVYQFYCNNVCVLYIRVYDV